jgi:diguanylate cyclase
LHSGVEMDNEQRQNINAGHINSTQSSLNVDVISGDYKNSISNAKIMVINDEVINAEVMRNFLSDYGFKNIIFVDELINIYEIIFHERPDIILYDNNELNPVTFDILKHIRTNIKTRLIPFLILTAEADEVSKLKALELGVVDVILKPASANELALRLRNLLSVKTYHDHIANFDSLTHLPNRENFINHLDRALKYANRYKTTGALLQIGLERFTHISDAYGNVVCNQILKTVAERITNTTRKNDIVSRVDELDMETTISRVNENDFSILLPILAKADDAAFVAMRLYDQIIEPYLIDGKELHIGCSIGIAIYPEDGSNKDSITNCATIALNEAKKQIGTPYKYYSKDLNISSKHRIQMESNLRKAIIENEFEVYYQPKISMQTKQIIGAEALLRWQHPELGFISPDEFIPVADDTGYINAIGHLVTKTVIHQIAQWQQAGLTVPSIAINFSSHQFNNEDLLETITDTLNDNAVSANNITIELTETAFRDNVEQIILTLTELKALGAKISLDDFGTGYSSLAQLKLLPLDEIKIDRSFTADIGLEKNTEAIILAIIAMSHSLGLTVVAEGVETEAQFKYLFDQHCDYYQGYLFSPAVTTKDFGLLLASGIKNTADIP